MRSCLCWLFSIQWGSHSETWQQWPRLWSLLCNVNAWWQFLPLISTRAVICQRMLITSLSPARPLMGNKRNASKGQAPPQCLLCPPSAVRLRRPGPCNGDSRAHCRLVRPGRSDTGYEQWAEGAEIRDGQSQVWADSLRTPEMLGVMTTDTFQIITQWQIQSDTHSDNWRPREWRLWRLHSLIHYGHQSLILKFLFWEESVEEGLEWEGKKYSDIKSLTSYHRTIR